MTCEIRSPRPPQPPPLPWPGLGSMKLRRVAVVIRPLSVGVILVMELVVPVVVPI